MNLKNPIQSSLVLDHIYIDLPSEDFDALTKLTNYIKGCEHSHVKSSDDAWEGLYISTSRGSYFEFLRERRPGGLGIAMRLPKDSMLDAREIVRELPQLAWQAGRRDYLDGDPWFDWLSLGDYRSFDTFFNAWIMHYHPRENTKNAERPKCTIKGLTTLCVTLGDENIGTVKELSRWMPGEGLPLFGNTFSVMVRERDETQFNLQIKLVQGTTRFQFSALSMEIDGISYIRPVQIGNFKIQQAAHELLIKRSPRDRDT